MSAEQTQLPLQGKGRGRIGLTEDDVRLLNRALDIHAARGDRPAVVEVLKLLRKSEGRSFRLSELKADAELAIRIAGGPLK